MPITAIQTKAILTHSIATESTTIAPVLAAGRGVYARTELQRQWTTRLTPHNPAQRERRKLLLELCTSSYMTLEDCGRAAEPAFTRSRAA